VFLQLAAGTTTLPQATVNSAIAPAQVVVGGVAPYQISGQQFQIVDSGNNIIQQGSNSIGPGMSLTPGENGIWASGTPTVVGTYNFTFTVNDSEARNLQQVQYSMSVVAA
jgi:hypothetical protein